MNPIPLVYEDDFLIAADKPVGLSTIPERLEPQGDCLRRRLETQLGRELWVVHRLDKEVSGLILFAKTAAAHRFLNQELEHRRAEKTYQALVWGTLENEGLIEAPLREFGSGRMGVDQNKGKPSATSYQTAEAHPGWSLVRLHPHTGRRHQLRVHLYSLGHPIVGDPLYGDKVLQTRQKRLMLHSWKMRIRHPAESWLECECPPPSLFDEVVADFRQQFTED